jgi:hypothetical protein
MNDSYNVDSFNIMYSEIFERCSKNAGKVQDVMKKNSRNILHCNETQYEKKNGRIYDNQ